MGRPRKWRKVCSLPQSNKFGPLGLSINEKDVIIMTVDEYETIRLIDYVGFTQEECCEQMNVARTTVQSIYAQARRKIAQSLVNGKTILIEGGEYRLCDGLSGGCGRGCIRQKAGKKFNKNKETSMRIAIPVDKNDINSEVSSTFGRALYYLLYDTSDKKVMFIDNTAANSAGGTGIKAAQLLLNHEVKVVIAPRYGENAARVLVDANVTVYKNIAGSAQDNINAFINNRLEALADIHPGLHHGS